MNNTNHLYLNKLLLILLSVALTTPLYSYNLKINPREFLFTEVPVGKKFQLRMPLQIYNETNKATTFIMDTVKPSTIKADWIKGYQEIPNPSWLGFEKLYLKIPAHSVKNILMYIHIPKKEIYYNQHWVIALAIREKTANNRGGSYAYPKVYLETEKKKWLKSKPASGKIEIVPSTVLLKELQPGENEERGEFTIYNNDTVSHTYTLNPTGELAYGKKQPISPTDGFKWLPHKKWLRFRRKVTVAANKSRKIKIGVALPENDESLHKSKYESILYIEEEGTGDSPVFIRIRLEVL